MSINLEAYTKIVVELKEKKATLVAVSKTKPVSDIRQLYDQGQRDFGENYVQELVEKQSALPADIRWHFIGHLQSNKVKFIAPFVHLIHGIDSLKLLKEVDKQAVKNNRMISVLLQVHIATEETKFGFNEKELTAALQEAGQLKNVTIKGLMGMASFTDNVFQVEKEFGYLFGLYKKLQASHPIFTTLSMGMSGDYKTAITYGSNMVRIGSLLFGARNYG
ncbi:MAG: YggS family pyridoxal phosphate-dependent enzyme [Chitinophagaceae bacterium]|nr:YggS family pyridoxal phosphate-dependent enzyme [Chitinophagaceae bacterium]MCW5929191.1 YggS family pyridoxal phosphate-dependent enzyme [Chitinophagaceae bacterium]